MAATLKCSARDFMRAAAEAQVDSGETSADCEAQLENDAQLDRDGAMQQRTDSPASEILPEGCTSGRASPLQGHESSTQLLVPDGEPRMRLSRTTSALAARRQSNASLNSERSDALQCLSVVTPHSTSKEFGQEHSGGHAPRPGFPLPLMALVTLLAACAGFVVVGFGKAVIYAGCPLGINGCNEFYHYEDKGFKLIKALDGKVPQELVYIIVAALGALIVIQFITRLPVELAFQICGGGTLQSLEAVAVGYVIPLPAAALRFVCSVIYSGTGGPLGMEGPVIQICTILATNAGWALGIRAAPTQSVLASLGFACGFAASFNSPLAGILFVVEELQHVMSHFSRGMEVMVLVASIAPTVVYRACKGNSQHFYPRYGDEIIQGTKGGSLDRVFGEQLWMLVAIPIAMLCCLVNLAIILGLRHLNNASEFFHKRFEWWPITVTFVAHAIVVACIGVGIFRITGLRGIWGIGAESVQKALTEDFRIYEYFLFGFAKCLVMVIAVVVRAPGDILEPVLITGAFLGGGVGRCLVVWFGLGVEVMTPSIIFGMVGLFASCFRFPLTPVVIVIEVMGTEAYALIIPMVLASFTAVIMSSRICCPILAEIMSQDGIDLHGHRRTTHVETEDEEETASDKTSNQSKGSNMTSRISFKLGGLFMANINSLTAGEGLSHDYDFNRQESFDSDEESIAPISPNSPKTAWSEPMSPKLSKGGIPFRRQKTLGFGPNADREEKLTAVGFLRRQKTSEFKATVSQANVVEFGAPGQSETKQDSHDIVRDPEQGG